MVQYFIHHNKSPILKEKEVMLSFVLEFQWSSLPNKVKEDLKKSMMHPYPPQAIMDFIKLNEAPHSLEKIGFKIDDVDKAVALMLKNPYENPRPLDEEGLRKLIMQAYEGKLIGDRE